MKNRLDAPAVHLRAVVVLLAAAALSNACGGGGGSFGGCSGYISGFERGPERGLGNGTAELAWDAVQHPSLAGHRIYYGTSTRAYFQPFGQGINAGNTTRYTVKELGGAATHYFAVTAFDTCGNESAFSTEAVKAFD